LSVEVGRFSWVAEMLSRPSYPAVASLRWSVAVRNEDALMREIWLNIWNGLTTATPLDQTNLVLGVAGVWLMIRRSLWAFPIGLAAVTVQGILFYKTHFPADARLQIFYFGMLSWGWWHWVHDRGAAPELPVTTLSWRARGLTVAAATAAMIIWAPTVGIWEDAVMPWRDAFIAAFSVAAQLLQVRKNLENWLLWVVVNAVAVVSYWDAKLAYTAFLYAIYLVLAVLGWRSWLRPKISPVRRVAVFGPESTGKTMLAEKLAAHFGEPWVPEYAREFWDAHGKITLEDIPVISRRQAELEDATAARAKRVLICDTEALTTMLWSDVLYGECQPEVRNAVEARAKHYDLYLLLNTDVPFESDPQRVFPDEAGREKCMTIWRDALTSRKLPVVEIRGTWAEREAAAIAAVKKLLQS
jgi:nicotinamide mononucleotide transporter